MEKKRAYSAAEIENMVQQYGNMVFRLAFVKMKQKESADDIFQEVFIRLIKLRIRLDSHEHEKAWMIKTTLNCCKDMWKLAWVRHGMFTYEGYKRDISGYGYGTSKGDKYDFTYEASSGIKVYFVNHSNGKTLVFQAGNVLYQINSDAPVEDLKRLIESFEF